MTRYVATAVVPWLLLFSLHPSRLVRAQTTSQIATQIDSIVLPQDAFGTFGEVKKYGNQWLIKVSSTSNGPLVEITLLDDTLYHFIGLFKAKDVESRDLFRVSGCGISIWDAAPI